MLKLYDSFAKKVRSFSPIQKGKVTMYHCGPTVYDYVHIGNLRSFLFADLLRRYMEHRGNETLQVMNITDVGHMLADADEGEDKMDAAAAKAGKTPQQVAAFYTDAFFRDIDRLGVRRAHVYPRASDHVQEMIVIIQKLVANGHAYVVGRDGGTSVYFDVTSSKKYGKLSGNTLDSLEAGARVEVREEKKHPADFALWIVNPNHLMQWPSPWGSGYPGWHIECSAMAMKYLGETIDIHTGGEDNKFPHHECEIAQSEGATDKQFARTWMHVTHLLVDGQKMSKSKGNFYTLDDLVGKGFSPRAVRYLLLAAHYRQALNFTLEALKGAQSALDRLDAFADAVRLATPKQKGKGSPGAKAALKAFTAALDGDLNVAEALAALFEFVRESNERVAAGTFTQADRQAALSFIDAASSVFGFTFGAAAEDAEIPSSIMARIDAREEARKAKRFAAADRIRDELKELGWLVEDTSNGRRIKRV